MSRYPTVKLRGERSHGLAGPPCPERTTMAQGDPVVGPPWQAMCCRCGRITSRVDDDGLAWCGGRVPSV